MQADAAKGKANRVSEAHANSVLAEVVRSAAGGGGWRTRAGGQGCSSCPGGPGGVATAPLRRAAEGEVLELQLRLLQVPLPRADWTRALTAPSIHGSGGSASLESLDPARH